MKIVFVCSDCGSPNVQIKVWKNPNTGEIFDDAPMEQEDCWCEECQDNRSLDTSFEKSFPEENIEH